MEPTPFWKVLKKCGNYYPVETLEEYYFQFHKKALAFLEKKRSKEEDAMVEWVVITCYFADEEEL